MDTAFPTRRSFDVNGEDLGTATGGYGLASGVGASSYGYGSNTSGDYSVAVGGPGEIVLFQSGGGFPSGNLVGTTAVGMGASAFGPAAYANGALVTALGAGAVAQGHMAMALGAISAVAADYATAIGSRSVVGGD